MEYKMEIKFQKVRDYQIKLTNYMITELGLTVTEIYEDFDGISFKSTSDNKYSIQIDFELNRLNFKVYEGMTSDEFFAMFKSIEEYITINDMC